MTNRSIDTAGRDLIKSFESCRLEAYRDAAGVWTIGWGSTHDVHAGMKITQAEADERFEDDLAPAESAAQLYVKVPLSDNQYAALVSFTFNCGSGALRNSTMLKKLNAGAYAAVPSEMGRFVNAGGHRLEGLVRRRAAEAKLWNTPDTPAEKPAPASKPAAPAAAVKASSTAATKAPTMNPISILSELFGGVAGKLSAVSTVAQVAPAVVSGTIKNIGEVPKAISDIETLASDVKGGKWSNIETDAGAVLGEFGTILSNYGINLGKLNTLPQKMAKPAVTSGATISNAA